MDSKYLYAVTEDTVQCNFFSTASKIDAAYVEKLCDSVNRTIQRLSKGYIWHQDEFRVNIPLYDEQLDFSPQLVSTTCFGDNNEDEWFITYLILEITKEHSDLIVQVQDNDGDFLLIEAADVLPAWANPDTTENRVFIYKNKIHIIPPSIVDTDTELSLKDAVNIIHHSDGKTESYEIHQAILKRIGGYPNKINENIHTALVKLPLDVATLLTLKPSLISPIVTSYCNHDMINARTCRNVTFKDCATVQVKFTKYLYAMLTHSNLINLKNAPVNLNDKRSVLGLKLTCGYEIIMSKLKGDIFESREYNKFIKSLSDKGYFRGNIEGSKDYTRLLDKAKEFYINMECPINSQLSSSIAQIMNTEEFISMKDSIKNNPSSDSELVEDDDSWLKVNPDELNNLLNTRYGKEPTFKNEDVISAGAITSKLSNFLKETSDFEGIETNSGNNEDNEIEFDSDLFVSSLKNMLNIINGNSEMDADEENDDTGDFTPEDQLDEEIRTKLLSDIKGAPEKSESIISNMIQSMKEEQGAPGPASNILRSIGINKTEFLLDSDDDDI